MHLFLAAAHPPSVLSRGLYAGLKSRGGLPTPLPHSLNGEHYVNAGFIDGLSVPLINYLDLKNVCLRVMARGAISVQWYYLDRHGSIRHFVDVSRDDEGAAAHPSIHDLLVPPILLSEDVVSLVFFRISHDATSKLPEAQTELVDWCFYSDYGTSINLAEHKLPIISRSFGDSRRLVSQQLAHQLHYYDLQKRFPDLSFIPMPHLHVYESDSDEYHRSASYIREFQSSHSSLLPAIDLAYNPFNLGGGGNMCLAIKNFVSGLNSSSFVMLDSDTLVPFKTLYTTGLINAFVKANHISDMAISPVIAYRKEPTKVLEAGAIFGRGAWHLAVEKPMQPCIFPLHQGCNLGDKLVQARLAHEQCSDYPPFIYSYYSLSGIQDIAEVLPAPFFLRGDDVEYGFHLRHKDIQTTVAGYLLVFQDPKHSPWHEIMAILHSIVILCAYTNARDLVLLASHISSFFSARLEAHASMHDLHGISLYQEVLNRLLSLLEVPEEDLLHHFYSPDYYIQLRHVNAPYSHSNYKLSRDLADSMPAHLYRELPFLYYPLRPLDHPLPESVMLLNHLSESAALIHPAHVGFLEVQEIRQQFQFSLVSLATSLQSLQRRSQILLDRSRIYEYFSSEYAAYTKTDAEAI